MCLLYWPASISREKTENANTRYNVPCKVFREAAPSQALSVSALPLCLGLGTAQFRRITKSSVAGAMCCLVTELKRQRTSEIHRSMCCNRDQKRGLEPGQAWPFCETKISPLLRLEAKKHQHNSILQTSDPNRSPKAKVLLYLG